VAQKEGWADVPTGGMTVLRIENPAARGCCSAQTQIHANRTTHACRAPICGQAAASAMAGPPGPPQALSPDGGHRKATVEEAHAALMVICEETSSVMTVNLASAALPNCSKNRNIATSRATRDDDAAIALTISAHPSL